ncbi:MAG: alpha-2-macroglobulin family protein [Saprospiraceae bacterium]
MEFSINAFEKEWETIENFQNEGLPQSALKSLDSLLVKVRQENNPAQLVKCILKRQTYLSQHTENGHVQTILNIKKELKAAQSPVKEILQSALAGIYRSYYENNNWKIASRTNIESIKNDSIETWSAEQFFDTENQLYLESISNKNYLQTLDIKYFLAILDGGDAASDKLRPTLYDLLAHRALDHFMNDQSNLTQPNYSFVMRDPQYFSVKLDLAKTEVPKDISSYKWQALTIFEELEKFHTKDIDPTALLDVLLKRITYVQQHIVHKEKDKFYLSALESITLKYPRNQFSAEFMFKRAEYFYSKAGEYDINNPKDERKMFYVKAIDICNLCELNFPTSSANQKCRNLILAIKKPELSLSTENVNLPGRPILNLVNFKNTEKLFVKIIKLSPELNQKISEIKKVTTNIELLNLLNEQKPLKVWDFKLPLTTDYRSHSTEIMLDKGFDVGSYLLLSSESTDFSSTQTQYSEFKLSNISYASRNRNFNNELIVMDRSSGKPMTKVDVFVYIQKYNAALEQNESILHSSYKTDLNGIVTPKVEAGLAYSVIFTKGKDTLRLDESFYRYRDDGEPKSFDNTIFFLDRAIYRPGQTIYFKGLAIKYDKNKVPEIIANKKVTISFRDANYTEIMNLELKTNEFGTFHGEFTAPGSNLLGQMSINSSIGGNAHFFRVEEYKRPKFETLFKPIEGTYQLNDQITVTGLAKAFAGNNIDGAKVRYRVKREVIYPYWGYWCWWRPMPYSAGMEIESGETTTNQKGEFSVSFKAIPDESADKINKPQFNYTITADVIDINGETHTASTTVAVSELLLQVNLEIPVLSSTKTLKQLQISSTNLAGHKEATVGFIRISKLLEPPTGLIARKWDVPELPIISEHDFKKNFPYLPYKDEDKVQNWKVEKDVYAGLYDNKDSNEFNLDKVKWETGNYVVVLTTKDKNSMGIEIKKYFTLYDLATNEAPYLKDIFSVADRKTYEPNEKAKVFLGSKFDKLNVYFEIERKGKIEFAKWLSVKKLQNIPINITEADRGNVFYHLTYVSNNRFNHFTETINVPWSNKDLNIEYLSFRDKTLPGAKEAWKIKISGPKKDKVAAEMVATLYDASLDQFVPNRWSVPAYPSQSVRQTYASNQGFEIYVSHAILYNNPPGLDIEFPDYRQLMGTGLSYFYYGRGGSGVHIAAPMMSGAMDYDSKRSPVKSSAKNRAAMESSFHSVENTIIDETIENKLEAPVSPRSNLKETVFFMPNLQTDADGNIILQFTMNEALTRWKFLGMAHTTDLKVALTEKEIITQKDLMIIPNAPRFLREGDKFEFTAKVSNLSSKLLNGTATLQLFDAITNLPVDIEMSNQIPELAFKVDALQSSRLAWMISVPFGKVNALSWKVIAKAGNYSDGEENSLPIVSNRMLVTETMPLPVRAGKTASFNFVAMEKAMGSTTLQTKNLSLEFTSNPAWYAVQALPYLMEYPYDCTEQVFSRYYANSLASSVINAHPKVKQVFDSCKNENSNEKSLESALLKNQELKSALLEETPWVLQACSESQQKQNIALLFDLNRMSAELNAAIDIIADRQQPNGGFSWFSGGKENMYITQYLMEGFGHLKKLNVNIDGNPKLTLICNKAIKYLDLQFVEQYNELKKSVNKGYSKWEDNHLDPMILHFLYTRSFYLENEKSSEVKTAETYYLSQADKFWKTKGIYEQGLIALSLDRLKKSETPAKIIRSLKEKAINSDEMGMYWKQDYGYYWYQLPIETQSLMIEVFKDVAKDEASVDGLKTWLLKNKQTNQWESTKATASAVYALLMSGNNWLSSTKDVKIEFNGKPFETAQLKKEAGTGYFKTALLNQQELAANNPQIKPFSAVKVENPNDVVAWGAMYWQYLEDLDKIKTFKDTPLKIEKQLFRVENSEKGPILKAIDASMKLMPGDQIKVRIELRVDRDMEYLHMKDARASGFEPINVLSSYKWQGGLGYYESTGDMATNFFFDYLPKGTYVFEYPLFINHKGDFSNGITTIQCMYAPEFSSHSEGVRVKVD